MTRGEALAVLAKTLPDPGTDLVGPGVEAVAARLRAGEHIADDELDAALTLLLEYVREVQCLVVGAARVEIAPGKHRRAWYDVGARLGFPSRTASMRAIAIARKIGLMAPATPRDEPRASHA